VTRWPLGTVDVVFAPLPVPDAAKKAAALGFAHLDLYRPWSGDPARLPIPIGDRMAPTARDGFSMPAPLSGPHAWEDAVATLRRHRGMRLEPWFGSVCDSIEATKAMLGEVPGLRLLVDTGHVACWGEDPVELLPWADHVQLRQARPGCQQLMPEDGDVDFGAVFRALEGLDYSGRLSIEYFDKPQYGWALDDPVRYAAALAAFVRPLLS
jgi:sugar phosphate isomerase/epimerase